METSTRNYDVPVAGLGTIQVTVSERGEGAPFLLLHGGGGPLTVSRRIPGLRARLDRTRSIPYAASPSCTWRCSTCST